MSDEKTNGSGANAKSDDGRADATSSEGRASATCGDGSSGATSSDSGADATSGDSATYEPVRFDTKIAVLLREDLETWQRLNVTAFLVSGLGTACPEVIGEPYEDADGTPYLPMFRQPVLVFEGGKETLAAAHERAVRRGLAAAVFTSDLFATGHDRANRAAVAAVGRDGLDLVGIAVHGARNAVDKVLKGARMHG